MGAHNQALARPTPPLRTARCRHPIAPPRRVERKTPLAVSRTSRRPFLALVSGAGHPASAVLPRSPRTQLAMCSSRLSAATPIAGERAHLPLPSHPPSSTPATAGAVAKCAAGLLCAFHRLRVPPLIGHHTPHHTHTHTPTHTHIAPHPDGEHYHHPPPERPHQARRSDLQPWCPRCPLPNQACLGQHTNLKPARQIVLVPSHVLVSMLKKARNICASPCSCC